MEHQKPTFRKKRYAAGALALCLASAGCAKANGVSAENSAPVPPATITLNISDCLNPAIVVPPAVVHSVAEQWRRENVATADPSLFAHADRADFNALQKIGGPGWAQVVIFNESQPPAQPDQPDVLHADALDFAHSVGITQVDVTSRSGIQTGNGGVKHPIAGANIIAILPDANALGRICTASVY